MDFYSAFYDTWVTRDLQGRVLAAFYPAQARGPPLAFSSEDLRRLVRLSKRRSLQ